MPKVLVISRYFPPLSSVGASIRLVKILKFASEQDWSFIVLTQDAERPVIDEKRLSEFLLLEVPPETLVIRIGNPFFGQNIIARLGQKIFGDSSLPWGISVTWQGWKKFHKFKPDLIFVNSPPFTNVAIGLILSLLLSVPIVLDMKDDWVGSPAYWRKGPFRRNVESWIEKEVVKKISAAVIVTRSSYDSWLKRYSSPALTKKIFFISNGEDLDEYKILWNRQRKLERNRPRLFTAAAGYRQNYRDLTPFLQALELFMNRNSEIRDYFDIEFAGEQPDNYYKNWFEKLLPPTSLIYSGVLDRKSLIEHLWQADLFFIVQPYNNSTAISGTLYEYWATGKAPVLLFSDSGASSQLILENHLGKHFNFNQVKEASYYIEQVIQACRKKQPIWIDRSGSENFDRRKLVQQMVLIWSDCIKNFRRN